jgi:hypothetical protein
MNKNASAQSEENRPKIVRRGRSDPLAKLFAEVKRDHPSLIGVFEFEYDAAQPEPSAAQLIRAAGINGYTELDIGVPKEDGYRQNFATIGGFVAPVRTKGAADIRTVIFLRYVKGALKELMDTVNTAILFHELQHVDDLETGSLKKDDGAIDMVQAEYDAHENTCEALWIRGLPDAMAFYLATLHQHVREIPERAEAARRFIASPKYEQYRAYAYMRFDYWVKQCTPPGNEGSDGSLSTLVVEQGIDAK